MVSKGLAILACWARTTAEIERVCKQEQALSTTEKTRPLEDLLRLTKGTTRAPANNFWELKINITTFMSLIWVLFGSNCDYYKSLWQIYKTLELKEVYALKAKFSPEHCRRITWEILDNGCTFFDDVKTTIDFTGTSMSFPPLFLIDILNIIRYTVLVEQASFPDECRYKGRAREDQSSKTLGGQGGDSAPVIPHQPQEDRGKLGVATTGRITMDRADLGEDRDSPRMQDMTTTPLGTGG